jgi:hypothetical protein
VTSNRLNVCGEGVHPFLDANPDFGQNLPRKAMKGDVFVNSTIRSFCVFLLLVTTHFVNAEPIPVHFAQGSSHGFVTLETLEGKTLATGENTQTVHGDRVT